MKKDEFIVESNKEIFINEKKHEAKLLKSLKQYPLIYNKYLIKSIFDEEEIELLKKIKNRHNKKKCNELYYKS